MTPLRAAGRVVAHEAGHAADPPDRRLRAAWGRLRALEPSGRPGRPWRRAKAAVFGAAGCRPGKARRYAAVMP